MPLILLEYQVQKVNSEVTEHCKICAFVEYISFLNRFSIT